MRLSSVSFSPLRHVAKPVSPFRSRAARSLAFCGVCLPLLLLGCGSGDGKFDLVPVQGVVTLDGKPLPAATVVFEPQAGRPSKGTTDADGRYSLIYTQDKTGALPGKHKVSISTATEDDDGPVSKEQVPRKYNANTTLEVELTVGQRDPVNFDLTSGKN